MKPSLSKASSSSTTSFRGSRTKYQSQPQSSSSLGDATGPTSSGAASRLKPKSSTAQRPYASSIASVSSSASPPSSSVNEASIEKLLHLLASSQITEPLQVTDDMVKQVSRGALGELLTFLGGRMVGRQEVSDVRRKIHATMTASATSGEGIVHPSLVELEKAKRGLRAARVAVEIGKRERADARRKLEELVKEKAELEENLLRERELNTSLEALEAREMIRMKRIQEVKRMMHALRKRVEDAKLAGNLGFHINQAHNIKDINLKPPQWRPRNTKETIAKLHAYHIRLNSGRLAEAQAEKIRKAEESFRGVLRENLGRDVTDDEFREVLTKCREAAEAHAEKRRGYVKLSHDDKNWVVKNLQRADEVRIKEAKVITLNEEIAAKLFLVKKRLENIRALHERTDTIRQMLCEIDERTRGFVGLIKDDLVRNYAMRRESSSENNVSASNSEQVKRQLGRCQAMGRAVNKLSALQNRSECGAEMSTSYEQARRELEEWATNMLTRKVAKAKAGLDIAREIEVLVGEAKGLTL